MAQDAYAQLGRAGAGAFGGFFSPNGRARQAGEMAGLQQAHLQSTIAGQQAKLAKEEQDQAMASPEATLSRVSVANGVPTDTVPTLGAFFKTGVLPYAEPNGAGPLMNEPPVNKEQLGLIAQQFADARAFQSGDSTSLKDSADARSQNVFTGVQSGIADGTLEPKLGGTRLYGMNGGTPYSFNEYGVGDNYTGKVDDSSGPAQRFASKRGAETAADKARAAASYASANSSNASAARTRQEMDQGKMQYDPARGIMVNPRTGQAIPVTMDGTPIIPKSAAEKPLTEDQGKSTGFAARMQDAESTIQTLESTGISGKDLRTISASSAFSNFLASPKGQQYRQAQENWVRANLRKESGAVIGPKEMADEARNYFPIPGDSPEVIAQKAQNRRIAAQGMLVQAGPGANQVPGILDKSRSDGGQVRQVKTDADYHSLPSGTRFRAPDGTVRVKP